MAIIGLGGAIGPVIGAWGGGLIAEGAGWRTAFLVIAAPGLLLAPLAWLTLREPARGAANGAIDSAPPPPLLVALRELFAKRAFRYLIAGSALAGFTLNSFGQFMAPLFVRQFGLSYAEAGMYFGIISAISFTGGLLVGGFGADRLGKRDRRWQFWAPAAALLLAVPFFELALLAETAVTCAALLTAGCFWLMCYYAPALASVQDLAPPRSRASAAFVAAFVSGMVGSGLGPAVSGLLSDGFAHAAFAGDFLPTAVTDFLKQEHGLLIGGEWRAAASWRKDRLAQSGRWSAAGAYRGRNGAGCLFEQSCSSSRCSARADELRGEHFIGPWLPPK